MLYIYFGSVTLDNTPDIYVKHIDSWFNNYFEEDWTNNEWARRVVKEIDKSELISTKVIDSKWLGVTSVESLSGGAKQLIMANAVPNIVFNGNNFGDNCFPLLLELSKTKNIMMDLYYHPIFEWPERAEITSINTGNIVRSYKEFANEHMSSEVYGFTDFEKVNWPLALNMDAFKDDWFDSI